MNTAALELPRVDTAQLRDEVRRISSRELDAPAVRVAIRRLLMEHTACVGVAHWIASADGHWELQPTDIEGRVPFRKDFLERFAKCCETTTNRRAIQMERFLGLEAMYAPIQVFGAPPEVILVLSEAEQSARTVVALEAVSHEYALWRKETRSVRDDWKLASLAALVELVSEIEQQPTVADASELVANELVRYLHCGHIAISTQRRGRPPLMLLSGTSRLDPTSDVYGSLEMVCHEGTLRGEPGIWPSDPSDSGHLLLAHRQLADDLHAECVASYPLETPAGEFVGFLVAAGARELLQGDRFPNFMRACAPRLATALDVVRRAQRSTTYRALQAVGRAWRSRRGASALVAVAILVGINCLPAPYRIRCGCRTETVHRRFAVAPFTGRIQRGMVRPGDLVGEGDLLAEMDGQDVRFELAGVVAELEQAAKRRQIELAARKVPESILADLEYDRLAARRDLLEHRRSQLEVRSPLTGIILSGSLERAENAAVELGAVLFEVGPLTPLKLEIDVPAEDVSQVAKGQAVRIVVTGMEDQPIESTIELIRPRSELRNGRNVFVAECILANGNTVLRPGMEGRVRIDAGKHPLAWNLFHKPWNYLTSCLVWW